MISIIDDDAGIRWAVQTLVESMGFEARTYANAAEFLSSSSASIETTCLIADIQMPNMTGLELCAKLKTSGAAYPIILFTGLPTEEVRERALKNGAACCFGKPLQADQLLPWLEGTSGK